MIAVCSLPEGERVAHESLVNDFTISLTVNLGKSQRRCRDSVLSLNSPSSSCK